MARGWGWRVCIPSAFDGSNLRCLYLLSGYTVPIFSRLCSASRGFPVHQNRTLQTSPGPKRSLKQVKPSSVLIKKAATWQLWVRPIRSNAQKRSGFALDCRCLQPWIRLHEKRYIRLNNYERDLALDVYIRCPNCTQYISLEPGTYTI